MNKELIQGISELQSLSLKKSFAFLSLPFKLICLILMRISAREGQGDMQTVELG